MFYRTPKLHKIQQQQQQQTLEELTMRPIITNIDTAAYKITKYLNNLLTPLSKSDYNILNTEDLIKRLREETISAGYKMIFIDVKNLFTNVPLNKTIDFILKKVYDEKKIQTNKPKRVLKKLLCLCTKHLDFNFNNNIYIRCDGVAIGSPLGHLLANTFMTSLEEDLILILKLCLCNKKRYVDDTHSYVEPTKVEFVLNKLNNYHPNINFTFELERNNEINFLDVLIKKVDTGKCPSQTCTEDYIGKTDRRIKGKIIYHNKRDKN